MDAGARSDATTLAMLFQGISLIPLSGTAAVLGLENEVATCEHWVFAFDRQCPRRWFVGAALARQAAYCNLIDGRIPGRMQAISTQIPDCSTHSGRQRNGLSGARQLTRGARRSMRRNA